MLHLPRPQSPSTSPRYFFVQTPRSSEVYSGIDLTAIGDKIAPEYLVDIFSDTNEDIEVQGKMLMHLSNKPSKEIAALPLFKGACEAYIKFVMFSVCVEAKKFFELEDKGKFFQLMIRTSENEDIPISLKTELFNQIKWLNGKRAFNNLNLQNADLSGADLNGFNFQGTDFTNADLSKALLSGAQLTRAILDGANLHLAELVKAELSYSKLIMANLTDANLNYAKLDFANLHCANLSGASFQSAELTHTTLVSTKLINANLRKANMTGANITYADLTDADLTDTNQAGVTNYKYEGV